MNANNRRLVWLCLGIFFLVGSWMAISFAQTTQRGTMGTSDDRYVNISNENDIFELDSAGEVMPSSNGKISAYFEEDGSGNIQPKDQACFDQDSSGDYEPIQ